MPYAKAGAAKKMLKKKAAPKKKSMKQRLKRSNYAAKKKEKQQNGRKTQSPQVSPAIQSMMQSANAPLYGVCLMKLL